MALSSCMHLHFTFTFIWLYHKDVIKEYKSTLWVLVSTFDHKEVMAAPRVMQAK